MRGLTSMVSLALGLGMSSLAGAQEASDADSAFEEAPAEQGQVGGEGWNEPTGEYGEYEGGAQDLGDDSGREADEGDPYRERDSPKWFVGLHGRLNWVPAFLQEIVVAEALAVVGPGFNVVGTARVGPNFSVVFGLGYVSYGFEGAYRAKGDEHEDTEYLDSSMGVVHATTSLLWDLEVADKLAFEYGFGLDLAIITGRLMRSEAYLDDSGEWQACRAVLNPPVMSERGEFYCEPTQSGRSTDAYDADGAHYGVEEENVPPVLPLPSIPHLALRYEPHEQVALKLEMGYGVFQLWFGLSAHYGFK